MGISPDSNSRSISNSQSLLHFLAFSLCLSFHLPLSLPLIPLQSLLVCRSLPTDAFAFDLVLEEFRVVAVECASKATSAAKADEEQQAKDASGTSDTEKLQVG